MTTIGNGLGYSRGYIKVIDRTLTVLVVGADDDARTRFCDIVTGAGYKGLTASSVKEALPLLAKSDMLILDWKLGKTTSDVVLAEWVAGSGIRPVLVISENLDVNERASLLVRGAYHSLEKPVGVDVLLTLLRRYKRQVDLEHSVLELKKRLDDLSKRSMRMLIVVGAIAVIGAGEPVADTVKMILLALF